MRNPIPATQVVRAIKGIVFTSAFHSHARVGDLSTPALAGRTKGVVKWFNAEKGTGFLTTPDGHDIFVAASVISGSCNGMLREGQAVEFDIVVVKQATPGVPVEKRTAKDVTRR